jgi:hypothetical protein
MKNQKGSFVLMLSVVISIAIIIFLFSRMYLTSKPVLSPDPLTSATSGQNQIQQMNAYKNDAERAKQQLEGKNGEANKLLSE